MTIGCAEATIPTPRRLPEVSRLPAGASLVDNWPQRGIVCASIRLERRPRLSGPFLRCDPPDLNGVMRLSTNPYPWSSQSLNRRRRKSLCWLWRSHTITADGPRALPRFRWPLRSPGLWNLSGWDILRISAILRSRAAVRDFTVGTCTTSTAPQPLITFACTEQSRPAASRPFSAARCGS